MRARKWFLRIAGGFVAFVILLALAFAVLVSMRQRAIKPLDREELARLGIAVPDRENSPADAAEPQSAAGSGATRNTSLGADSDVAPDARSEAKRAAPPSLTRVATMAETRRFLGNWPGMSLGYRVRSEVGIRARQCIEAVVWVTGGQREPDFPLQIGLNAMALGHLETAREYLREALPEAEDEHRREVICAQLAWLEDDPAVAAAVLQRSCASANRFNLYCAMSLAILTHSEESAEVYFQRWSEVMSPEKVADWLAGKIGNTDPEIEAWKKRHVTKSD